MNEIIDVDRTSGFYKCTLTHNRILMNSDSFKWQLIRTNGCVIVRLCEKSWMKLEPDPDHLFGGPLLVIYKSHLRDY